MLVCALRMYGCRYVGMVVTGEEGWQQRVSCAFVCPWFYFQRGRGGAGGFLRMVYGRIGDGYLTDVIDESKR